MKRNRPRSLKKQVEDFDSSQSIYEQNSQNDKKSSNRNNQNKRKLKDPIKKKLKRNDSSSKQKFIQNKAVKSKFHWDRISQLRYLIYLVNFKKQMQKLRSNQQILKQNKQKQDINSILLQEQNYIQFQQSQQQLIQIFQSQSNQYSHSITPQQNKLKFKPKQLSFTLSKLSKYVFNYTLDQCKSHHYAKLKSCKTVDGIIQFLLINSDWEKQQFQKQTKRLQQFIQNQQKWQLSVFNLPTPGLQTEVTYIDNTLKISQYQHLLYTQFNKQLYKQNSSFKKQYCDIYIPTQLNIELYYQLQFQNNTYQVKCQQKNLQMFHNNINQTKSFYIKQLNKNSNYSCQQNNFDKESSFEESSKISQFYEKCNINESQEQQKMIFNEQIKVPTLKQNNNQISNKISHQKNRFQQVYIKKQYKQIISNDKQYSSRINNVKQITIISTDQNKQSTTRKNTQYKYQKQEQNNQHEQAQDNRIWYIKKNFKISEKYLFIRYVAMFKDHFLQKQKFHDKQIEDKYKKLCLYMNTDKTPQQCKCLMSKYKQKYHYNLQFMIQQEMKNYNLTWQDIERSRLYYETIKRVIFNLGEYEIKVLSRIFLKQVDFEHKEGNMIGPVQDKIQMEVPIQISLNLLKNLQKVDKQEVNKYKLKSEQNDNENLKIMQSNIKNKINEPSQKIYYDSNFKQYQQTGTKYIQKNSIKLNQQQKNQQRHKVQNRIKQKTSELKQLQIQQQKRQKFYKNQNQIQQSNKIKLKVRFKMPKQLFQSLQQRKLLQKNPSSQEYFINIQLSYNQQIRIIKNIHI